MRGAQCCLANKAKLKGYKVSRPYRTKRKLAKLNRNKNSEDFLFFTDKLSFIAGLKKRRAYLAR